jgi:transposase InsO family protein
MAPAPAPPARRVASDDQPLPHRPRPGHPQPKKRPRSSYVRFQAALPNQTWQADFTHYRLADATDAEILTWLDDHSRYALHVSAWPRVTGPIARDTFRAAVAAHGTPRPP